MQIKKDKYKTTDNNLIFYLKHISLCKTIPNKDLIELFVQIKEIEKKKDRLKLFIEHIKDQKTEKIAHQKIKQLSVSEKKIKDKIAESNLCLVVAIAKNYQNHEISFIDLIEEGNVGLMEAINHYNCTKGCQFSTYATCCIKHCIEKIVSNKSKLIHIPFEKTKQLAKIEDFISHYTKITGKTLAISIISKNSGIAQDKLEEILQFNKNQSIEFKDLLSENANLILSNKKNKRLFLCRRFA